MFYVDDEENKCAKENPLSLSLDFVANKVCFFVGKILGIIDTFFSCFFDKIVV